MHNFADGHHYLVVLRVVHLLCDKVRLRHVLISVYLCNKPGVKLITCHFLILKMSMLSDNLLLEQANLTILTNGTAVLYLWAQAVECFMVC